MTRPMEERRGRSQVGVGTQTGEGSNTSDLECTCCEPPNPLILRADLGLLSDGSAEYALCVLHHPEPMVYRNRGDGEYVKVPGFKVNNRGEIIDAQGQIVAQVHQDEVQRLTTVDDEDPPPSGGGGGRSPSSSPGGSYAPHTTYVDLSQDDFYHTCQRN